MEWARCWRTSAPTPRPRSEPGTAQATVQGQQDEGDQQPADQQRQGSSYGRRSGPLTVAWLRQYVTALDLATVLGQGAQRHFAV